MSEDRIKVTLERSEGALSGRRRGNSGRKTGCICSGFVGSSQE